MKRTFFTALFLLAAAALSAEDKIIASWDFSQKEPLNSGTVKLVLRGKSVIENGMLIASNSDKTKPSGAVVWAKSVKELTPQGAFSLSVTFMIGSAWTRPARQYAYLFDTKYVENRDKFHKGFMFYLATADGKSFAPCAAFGFGEKSVSARGKTVTLKPDELHTAEVLFSGTGKVSFIMDGKPCGTGNVPTGAVESSKYAPVIGDRVGSDYGPLGGGIRKVVLKAVEK